MSIDISGDYESGEVWVLENGVHGHWSSGHNLPVVDGQSVLLTLSVHGCSAAQDELASQVTLEAKGHHHEPYFKTEDHLPWLSPASISNQRLNFP